MKVFISWSGDLSHKVALCLRDWLPSVIQAIEPYVSSEDIDKGARWSTDISKELESSSYGILCVTTGNLESSWLNFEAGALSKSVDKSRVSPFLFEVKRSEVKGPLLQFQSTIFDREDVFKLIKSINAAHTEGALSEERLAHIFEVWWPEIEKSLKELAKEEKKEIPAPQPISEKEAILEEILELVRRQQLLLNAPEKLLPPDYLRNIGIDIGPRIEQDYRFWRQLASMMSRIYRELEDISTKNQSDSDEFIRLRNHIRRVFLMLEDISKRYGVPMPIIKEEVLGQFEMDFLGR